MVKGFIGQKIEMTQVFDSHGRVVPTTRVKVTPNTIVQIKTIDKDGYKAVQIGAGERKKANKPTIGRIKMANLEKASRTLREVEADGDVKVGDTISPEQFFRKGMLVDITGISKGKGFAGVVKRWGFAGGPRTHGQSDRERAGGSIGASTTPGRVYKGLKMAGHMGSSKTTIQGLEIMEVKNEEGEILVKGSIPGARGNFMLVRKSRLKKKSYHEPEIPDKPMGAKPEEEAKEQTTETPDEKIISQSTTETKSLDAAEADSSEEEK